MMNFITEEELRSKKHVEPFTIYRMKSGEKLTPSARQYLLDQKIDIVEVSETTIKKTSYFENWVEKQLKWLGSEILLVAVELFEKDPKVVEELIKIKKHFSGKDNACSSIEEHSFIDCHGMKFEGRWLNQDDCFEISEEHLKNPKGKEMLLLHGLRSKIRGVEAGILLELHCNSKESNEALSQEILQKLYLCMNRLSQMICMGYGGEKCHKNH
ncbi:conserved hypothetical protein [Alkaliphilus metalliredigens QYMF]|uniref:Cobalamin adenosyltransferase-like domain-containing protein n=1 Tax=Alkaliphilus metalliredigens (strain QYMF) TaxID=293826 RepID=A6TUT1_ALKMQ|nr:hypothetical protein [Alkaliphilus metalliredigens]ABR49949.1 conserved hypothetical protein [Alkaliphilus metalliredigens QYMF]